MGALEELGELDELGELGELDELVFDCIKFWKN